MIQQLSVAAARIMENGSASSGSSKAELIEEEDLFVAALAELNQYFEGVACAAKTYKKEPKVNKFQSNEIEKDNSDNGHELIQGRLQPVAARVVMQSFQGARLARLDLPTQFCYLATTIAEGGATCD